MSNTATRTRFVESKIIDVSESNLRHDEEAQRFQKESWPVRREIFKKNRTGEPALNEMQVPEWYASASSPIMVLIDGTFAHSAAVYFAKKYIDYRKLQYSLKKAETIHYFSANSDSEKIARFLHYIRSIEGCEVVVKQVPKIVENKNLKVTPTYRSIAVDMSIVALREAYDNADIRNALILSRDPEIIPLIKELRDLEINVALARCPDIATSRHLLVEANTVINVYDFFEHFDSYSETEIKPRAIERDEDHEYLA
jgi:uncharacterized LabA/DUF88 family protein